MKLVNQPDGYTAIYWGVNQRRKNSLKVYIHPIEERIRLEVTLRAPPSFKALRDFTTADVIAMTLKKQISSLERVGKLPDCIKQLCCFQEIFDLKSQFQDNLNILSNSLSCSSTSTSTITGTNRLFNTRIWGEWKICWNKQNQWALLPHQANPLFTKLFSKGNNKKTLAGKVSALRALSQKYFDVGNGLFITYKQQFW